MKIPLVDLSHQHRKISGELETSLNRIMEDADFILGHDVGVFESAFARVCDVHHCVGVGNGTDALELSLRALGIRAGDEVILPANTFIATALAVVRAGARPVLVDCDANFQLIDVDAVEREAGPKTAAVISVDLFGQMAPVEDLEALAAARGFALVEDAAQAQGASQKGRRAGSVGMVAATSFYPGKNLGAYGDAGAVLTDDDDIAERVRRLRNCGSDRKYHHPEVGFNSRLDTVQAAVLNAKLPHLDGWNCDRRRLATRYRELLESLDGVALPEVLPGNEPVWHIYAVRVRNRDRVLAALQASGVGAGVHYPVPIHLQGAFSDLGHGVGDFPQSEAAAEQLLSLPIFPGMTSDQQEYVASALGAALESV